MMRRVTTIALFLLCLGGACLFAQTTSTRPVADANAPWGAESKGIALRLLARADYCQGESMDFFLEVKNVSKEKKYLAEVFNHQYTKIFTLTVKGPDGKALSTGVFGGYSIPATAFRAIEPNEVWRICFADLGNYYTSPDKATRLYLPGFREVGKYAAQCTYMGASLSAAGEGVTEEMKAGNWTGKAVSKPTKDGLRVHEWGVFTVQPDVSHANAGLKAEWASLPETFYRQFPTQKLRYMPLMVNKPIVYFYSAHQAMRVSAKVRFPGGAPVVWWPAAAYPFDGGMGAPMHARALRGGGEREANAPKVFDDLTWEGWLGWKNPRHSYGEYRPAEEPYEDVTESAMPENCWVAQARIKGPLPITVAGSARGGGRAFGQNVRETERFLFYDGLVKVGDWLRFAGREANAVVLQNAGAFDIADLFVIERASTGAGGKSDSVGFAQVKVLKAGAKERIALPRLAAKEFAATAPPAVRKALLAAGLYEAEADSLLSIWRPGFFERGGVTALFVLPRAEYDRMLPLEIEPQPGEIVRVGVALYPAMEASLEVAKRAAELIAKLDSDDFKARDAATKGLLEMGPAVFPHVEAALKAAKSAEVQSRCRDILEALDAREWLKPGLGKGK